MFTMQVSFHVVEDDAIVHQDKMPVVPTWDNLMSLNEVVPWLKEKIKSGEIKVPQSVQLELDMHDSKTSARKNYLFELRPTNIANYYHYLPDGSTTFYYWMKTCGELSDSERLHRYLIAYNTDATMATSVLRTHSINNFKPSMVLSLDHNIWMHKHIMRADGWLLYENTTTTAGTYSPQLILMIIFIFKPVPYRSLLQEKIEPGQTLIVKGSTIDESQRFTISFHSKSADFSGNDVPLHISVRFDEGKVVMNSFSNGEWGKEERKSCPIKKGDSFDIRIRAHDDRYQGKMPFEKGVGFDLAIKNEPYAFQIFVNGERFASFAHRTDPNDITGLQIQGDIELTGIHIQ
uniref:Galectin n=1 Tax=Heterorhabditis bacteriophora TaxID=37862 RepID=A0A1I7XPK6_HETBA